MDHPLKVPNLALSRELKYKIQLFTANTLKFSRENISDGMNYMRYFQQTE